MLYDAHVHVGMFDDIESLVKCARLSNITPICVGITLDESLHTLELFKAQNIKLPVFVGIHPWYLKDQKFDFSLIEKLLSFENVVGIGECGLDNKIEIPVNFQIEVLEQHLELASKYALPVNLHIRGCHGELIRVLKKYQGRVKGFVHNFTFSYDLAKKYLDLGTMLSVGHHITFNQAKLNSVLEKVGLENFVLETDADFLHTGPYDPNLIKREYECICSLFNRTMDETEIVLENNLKRVIPKIATL